MKRTILTEDLNHLDQQTEFDIEISRKRQRLDTESITDTNESLGEFPEWENPFADAAAEQFVPQSLSIEDIDKLYAGDFNNSEQNIAELTDDFLAEQKMIEQLMPFKKEFPLPSNALINFTPSPLLRKELNFIKGSFAQKSFALFEKITGIRHINVHKLKLQNRDQFVLWRGSEPYAPSKKYLESEQQGKQKVADYSKKSRLEKREVREEILRPIMIQELNLCKEEIKKSLYRFTNTSVQLQGYEPYNILRSIRRKDNSKSIEYKLFEEITGIKYINQDLGLVLSDPNKFWSWFKSPTNQLNSRTDSVATQLNPPNVSYERGEKHTSTAIIFENFHQHESLNTNMIDDVINTIENPTRETNSEKTANNKQSYSIFSTGSNVLCNENLLNNNEQLLTILKAL